MHCHWSKQQDIKINDNVNFHPDSENFVSEQNKVSQFQSLSRSSLTKKNIAKIWIDVIAGDEIRIYWLIISKCLLFWINKQLYQIDIIIVLQKRITLVSQKQKSSVIIGCAEATKKNQNLSAKFQRQNFAQKKSKRILFFLIYQNWRKTSLSRQSILLVILSSSISSGSHKILCNSSGLYTGLSTPVMCVRGQWIQCMKKSLKILE